MMPSCGESTRLGVAAACWPTRLGVNRAVLRRTAASSFFVCWWYTVCVSLTSADAGYGAWAADAGPSMVRILVHGEGGGVSARAAPDMAAASSADLTRDSQHPAVPGIRVRLGQNHES